MVKSNINKVQLLWLDWLNKGKNKQIKKQQRFLISALNTGENIWHGTRFCFIRSGYCCVASLFFPQWPRAFLGRRFCSLTADFWSLFPRRLRQGRHLSCEALASHTKSRVLLWISARKHKNPQSRVIPKGVRLNSLSPHSTGLGLKPLSARAWDDPLDCGLCQTFLKVQCVIVGLIYNYFYW